MIQSFCKGYCDDKKRFVRLSIVIFLCFRLVLIEALDSILSNRFSSSKMSSACPSSRYGHVAAVINDEMLLWGGIAVRESTGEKFVCFPDLIECFNLLTSQWNERRATSNSPSDLPHPCAGARICVVQNRDIYQFGGFYLSYDFRSVYSNDVHKLDGSTLEWQRIHSNDQSSPSGRMDNGMCVLGKKGDEHLVVMGGCGTKIVSTIPDGSQFIPLTNNPDLALNNEVWLFCIRKSE